MLNRPWLKRKPPRIAVEVAIADENRMPAVAGQCDLGVAPRAENWQRSSIGVEGQNLCAAERETP